MNKKKELRVWLSFSSHSYSHTAYIVNCQSDWSAVWRLTDWYLTMRCFLHRKIHKHYYIHLLCVLICICMYARYACWTNALRCIEIETMASHSVLLASKLVNWQITGIRVGNISFSREGSWNGHSYMHGSEYFCFCLLFQLADESQSRR